MDFSAGVAISLHLFLNGDYNPLHPYARVEADMMAAGIYLNSESTLSTYISKDFELVDDYELEVGAVTGYSDAKIMPFIRVKKDNFFIAPVQEIWHGKKNYGIVVGYQF